MKRVKHIWLFVALVACASCQQVEETDIQPEVDFAEPLYGIWNRTDLGLQNCPDPRQNKKEFSEGSVEFSPGGRYTTYSNTNGRGKINTVSFTADQGSITFLSTNTTWIFDVVGEQMTLKTNAPNGCERFVNYKIGNDSF
jgi:hypothetical protein